MAYAIPDPASSLFTAAAKGAVPVYLFTPASFKSPAHKALRARLSGQDFSAAPGQVAILFSPAGPLESVAVGVSEELEAYSLAPVLPALAKQVTPATLKKLTFSFATPLKASAASDAAIGWALGAYAFTRYKPKAAPALPRLVWPVKADRAAVSSFLSAVWMLRDLINTPAQDLSPDDLAGVARGLAGAHKAKISVIRGADLVKQNYPMIHAVGRASSRPPCLIDLSWGSAKAPRLTLIGKGVCFDTGGLDIKPSANMLLMKKDMGGAAHVLALAHLVMAAKIPVRLRVLIPAADNAIDGGAFRPGDILTSRKGLTVEVGNTDAEGRLLLADALAEASRDKPDLLIDMATLTGAAHVAVGHQIASLFARQDRTADAVMKLSRALHDPLWRMPLWEGYRKDLSSPIADLSSTGHGPAGSITAALFLDHFVVPGIDWMHFDFCAWSYAARPGRPVGGAEFGLRALFAYVQTRFGG